MARSVAFNAADLGSEDEMDAQGRVSVFAGTAPRVGIENSRSGCTHYKGQIEVLSEKIYEERKPQAAQLAEEDM